VAVTPQYFVILVVDIEKFGTRPNPVQTFLRGSLYALMERALDEAGIDHRGGARPVDRGDGLFLLLPGSVPKTDLVGPFIARLRTGLRAHAQTSSDAAALRLRVVLHSGEVAWDGRGWVGEDLNTACRMVDHQPLRDALAAAGDAQLVLGISDGWHRGVLRHDYPQLDAAAFRPVRFDAKEIHDETVWVLVPGYAAPPGLEHAAPAGLDDAGPVQPAAAGRTARHTTARHTTTQHTSARPAPGPAPHAAPHSTPRRPDMTTSPPDEPSSVSVSQNGGGTQQAVGVNHGQVTQIGGDQYVVHPDATPQERYDKGRRLLEAGLRVRAEELIGEAVAQRLNTPEVLYYWALSIVSRRAVEDLSAEDMQRLQAVEHLAGDLGRDPYGQALRVVLMMLDEAFGHAPADGAGDELSSRRGDTSAAAAAGLSEERQSELRDHLRHFGSQIARERGVAAEKQDIAEHRMDNRRSERAPLFFEPEPLPPVRVQQVGVLLKWRFKAMAVACCWPAWWRASPPPSRARSATPCSACCWPAPARRPPRASERTAPGCGSARRSRRTGGRAAGRSAGGTSFTCRSGTRASRPGPRRSSPPRSGRSSPTTSPRSRGRARTGTRGGPRRR
jgi:hypothetical protein